MWGKKVKTEDNDSGMCGERRLKQRTMIQKLYMHCVHTLYMHDIHVHVSGLPEMVRLLGLLPGHF